MTEQVKVTQADREAAEKVIRESKPGSVYVPLLEAFARHRIAAQAELLEALVEAEQALCNHACHLGPDVPCKRSREQCDAECGLSAGFAIISARTAIAKAKGEA